MKRGIRIILVAAALLGLLAGCTPKWSEVRISSIGLRSFELTSPKSFDLVLDLGVDNPAPDFYVDSLKVAVKAGERPIVLLGAGDVQVAGEVDSCYVVPVRATLADGINIFYIMGALKEEQTGAFKADLWARVRLRGRFGKTIEYKDIPVDELKDLF